MSLEKESLTHKIEDDLALRNRNWDKLTSHLAESANKHIKESGSNANGNYIKYDDGTMFVYYVSASNESRTDFTVTYPATFVVLGGYAPIVLPHFARLADTSQFSRFQIRAYNGGTSFRIVREGGAGVNHQFTYMAIGRWK